MDAIHDAPEKACGPWSGVATRTPGCRSSLRFWTTSIQQQLFIRSRCLSQQLPFYSRMGGFLRKFHRRWLLWLLQQSLLRARILISISFATAAQAVCLDVLNVLSFPVVLLDNWLAEMHGIHDTDWLPSHAPLENGIPQASESISNLAGCEL